MGCAPSRSASTSGTFDGILTNQGNTNSGNGGRSPSQSKPSSTSNSPKTETKVRFAEPEASPEDAASHTSGESDTSSRRDSSGNPIISASARNLARLKTPKEDDTDFIFDDCIVPRVTDYGAARRMSSRRNLFTFSDFTIKVLGAEDELDMGIIRSHLKKKGQSFQFGDFSLALTAKETEAANMMRLNAKIKNYCMWTLLGLHGRIKTVCVRPDEKYYVASCSGDCEISLFDIQTGAAIMSYCGHEQRINNAVFSLNGKYLATASHDCSVILWDATTGKQTRSFDHDSIVICCNFSNDGKYLISGAQDKLCRIWETRKGRQVRCLVGHQGVVISVMFSPDATCILSCSSDETVKIWELSGQCKHTLLGHHGPVISAMYSYDGTRVVSNDEYQIKVWNPLNGQCVLTLAVDTLKNLGTRNPKLRWTSVSYCPGCPKIGHYLVAAATDHSVRIFQSTTGKEIVAFYTKATVSALACGMLGSLVLGDHFGNIYVITLHSSK
eukprot:TRINITY_DN4620_c0_g2_i1.p1 TRINITY_DN4620_c0_g2~~TRINITY_DN4620_c0_g2_i1.p1  ORF type:complete len:498 (+),score=79.52 TRINITY_DN4620_c0_g2_i1:122-1615(+)